MRMKRRGFTLIELMIVVAVLVALMSIVFRLMGVGSSYERKSVTIKRLQRLNNALSGYYAAFGSYPPVKLHGSRNIYLKTNDWGIQEDDGQKESSLVWSSVNAACRSQPVAARYPFSADEDTREMIGIISETLRTLSQSDDPNNKKYKDNAAILGNGFDALERAQAEVGDMNETDWRKVQVFKFGLLSYLLPRYLFMTLGDDDLYKNCKQWTYNNEDQKQCYGDGRTTYTWKNIQDDIQNSRSARVEIIPSQSVCARWMANFEGIVKGGKTFFGVDTSDGSSAAVSVENAYPEVFCPTENRSNQYVLDGMTVMDGWSNEFYYYSAPPFQSYRLWSAGPNGKTFPPWIELSSLQGAERETAASWMADDVE